MSLTVVFWNVTKKSRNRHSQRFVLGCNLHHRLDGHSLIHTRGMVAESGLAVMGRID